MRGVGALLYRFVGSGAGGMSEKCAKNQIFRGVGISHGCVSGNVRFFRSKKPIANAWRQSGNPKEEAERLQKALESVRIRLGMLAKQAAVAAGEEAAEIFDIHAMLLSDEDFLDAMREELEKGACAEVAVERGAARCAAMLSALSDPYLRARAQDMEDLAIQLTDALTGKVSHADALDSGEPYILVARDLTPSDTVTLPKDRILGFVTFEGAANSHTAILARAMGIPALIGVGEIPEEADGCFALLDAMEGTLTVSPDLNQQKRFQKKQGEANELAREHDRYLRSLINKPAVTRSGHKMLIYANVGDPSEARSAILNGADGVGLFRSEFLYLSRDRYPTEEELYESYLSAVEAMEGKRIVIRTLDVGADKQIGYFDLPHEENPALGFRGIRLCLAREEIFKTQLRAILRIAARGSISLMIPMVVSVNEVRECKRLLAECMEELEKAGTEHGPIPELGIMIETPAAAIMCEELAREVEFFSVGTNDLLQYTLAADRQNANVNAICEENTEPVLRLIERSTEAIHRHGGWIGICGELAAELSLTQRFADMEIDELSVSVPYLLGVREKVIECK